VSNAPNTTESGAAGKVLKPLRAVICFPPLSRLSEAVIKDVPGRGQITKKMPYT
jgi:hypothetical protein